MIEKRDGCHRPNKLILARLALAVNMPVSFSLICTDRAGIICVFLRLAFVRLLRYYIDTRE